MNEVVKTLGRVVVACVLVLALVFGIPFLGLQVMRMFGTQIESAKTDIYRENKSYVEGTVRDLRELQVDYVKADDSQKEALAGLILHRAGELDWERLPNDVRRFLNELKEKQ